MGKLFSITKNSSYAKRSRMEFFLTIFSGFFNFDKKVCGVNMQFYDIVGKKSWYKKITYLYGVIQVFKLGCSLYMYGECLCDLFTSV